MKVIEEIKERLRSYPHAKYESGDDYIRVLPQSKDGFTVELIIENGGCTVHYDGWHERFENVEEGLSCFLFGLSRDCRLKEYRRSGVVYKWRVEYKENDGWVGDSTTGLLIYPYFGKQEIRYLQNRLIEEEIEPEKADA